VARRTRGASDASSVVDRGNAGDDIVDPREFDRASDATGNGPGDGGSPGTGNGSGDTGTSEPPIRRRHRRSTAQKAASPNDIKGLAAILLSAHMMLAAWFETPELAIGSEEAAALATALVNVQRHYPAMAIELTEKVTDHVSLVLALARIYGTRIAAYKLRTSMAKRKPAADPTNVLPMTIPNPRATAE